MTVYVELIFLSNFCIDAFILCLTGTLLKSKINFSHLFMGSLMGGVCAAIYPFVGVLRIALKIFLAMLLPLFVKKISTFREYFVTLCCFLAISFVLAGCVLMLNGFSTTNLTFNPIIYGIFPILFGLSGFIITLLIGNLIYKLIPQRQSGSNLYKVTIANERGKISAWAYYDSGNRVWGRYGEKVVFVSKDIYDKLMPAKESAVNISTINGNSVVRATDATIKIYLGWNENKIYKVSIALGDMQNINQKILLHAEMLGG